jgi:hypothetical protein
MLAARRLELEAVGEGNDLCAAKPMPFGALGSPVKRLEENMRRHDPIEAVAPDSLANVEHAPPVIELGCFLDVKNSFKLLWHNTRLLPSNAEQVEGSTSVINESVTQVGWAA